MAEHNHITREIRNPGDCPACDVLHEEMEARTCTCSPRPGVFRCMQLCRCTGCRDWCKCYCHQDDEVEKLDIPLVLKMPSESTKEYMMVSTDSEEGWGVVLRCVEYPHNKWVCTYERDDKVHTDVYYDDVNNREMLIWLSYFLKGNPQARVQLFERNTILKEVIL